MDQAIFNNPLRWIVVRFWANCAIDFGEIIFFAVLEQWIPYGVGVADKANAAGSNVMDVATLDERSPVVVVAENRIAADLVEFTVQNADVFGAGKYKRTAAVDRPVTTEQLFFAIHKRPRRMADSEALE